MNTCVQIHSQALESRGCVAFRSHQAPPAVLSQHSGRTGRYYEF